MVYAPRMGSIDAANGNQLKERSCSEIGERGHLGVLARQRIMTQRSFHSGSS